MAELVLASASPRRRELLAAAGVEFVVRTSGVAEPPPAPGEKPASYARRLALEKARAVGPECAAAFVVGADTVIGFEGRVLGKPVGAEDACRMLESLAGKRHRVMTGVCVIAPGGEPVHSAVVSTLVTMVAAGRGQIEAYVATGEPLDKAGGYAIQGLGGDLVEAIDGCYSNVVGLPLCELNRLLGATGRPPPREFRCLLPDGGICPRLRGPQAA